MRGLLRCEAAAEAIAAELPDDDRIAVWAISRTFIDKIARHWDPGPEVITVPTVSNPNLHAQRGLFTVVRYQRDGTAPPSPRPPSIDALFAEQERPEDLHGHGLPLYEPFLFKFTVPASEARKLLFYLRRSGVHRASLFPSLHSITEVMLEERFVQRPLAPTVPTRKEET